MGLILDTSILVRGERLGLTAAATLATFTSSVLSQPTTLALSTVSIAELASGIERAMSQRQREIREQFLQHVMDNTLIVPVSTSIALRGGQLSGSLAKRGIQLGIADLLIGVTALELGYPVATHNVRHFRLIPDLQVVTL